MTVRYSFTVIDGSYKALLHLKVLPIELYLKAQMCVINVSDTHILAL